VLDEMWHTEPIQELQR